MTQASRTPKKRARPAWPDRFVKQLSDYGAIAPTAKAVGVGRSTVYDEMGRNPEFAADVHRVLDECVEEIEATLFQCARNPLNTTDRIFYLKTRKPDVYGDKLRQDQINQIRREAYTAAIGELEEQVARLPIASRNLLLAALERAAQKELTP